MRLSRMSSETESSHSIKYPASFGKFCIPTDKTVDKKYRLQLKMLDDIKKKLEVKEDE